MEIPADYIVQPDRICAPGQLSVSDDGLLEAIAPREEPTSSRSGTWLTPGFVDLQVNGFGGVDLMSAAPEEFRELGRSLARTGVTSFLPTVISAPLERMQERLRVLARTMEDWPSDAARPLGLHLEGPFLNPERCGTHREGDLMLPEVKTLRRLLDAAEGKVRLLTLAPELPGAEALIDLAVERGIRVALGHSNASYDVARRAVDCGASLCTHFGNAMAPIHQREPAVGGLCLSDDRVFVCLIPDLIHLHPGTLRLALGAKGARRIVLVTDATAAAGCIDGEYALGGRKIRLREGACRDEQGRLAGSGIRYDEGLDRFRGATGVGNLESTLVSATNAASALGVADQVGCLLPGRRADFIEWRGDDEDSARPARVWIAGRAVDP